MTPQQFVGLGARLFAIWMFLTALQTVSVGREVSAQGVENGAMLSYAVAMLYFVCAVLIWVFPMAIAHKLVPRTKFDDRLCMPGQQAAVVACVVVGLLVIAFKALGPLAWYLALVSIWVANGQPVTSMSTESLADGVSGLIHLAAGLLLIAKAHDLAETIMAPAVSAADDDERS